MGVLDIPPNLVHLRDKALRGEPLPHPGEDYLAVEDLTLGQRFRLAEDRYKYPGKYGPLNTHYHPFLLYHEKELFYRVCEAYHLEEEALRIYMEGG